MNRAVTPAPRRLTRADLHGYQETAVEFAKANKKAALILDMGLGKTAVTLTALQDLVRDFEAFKVLIVAPLRVARSTWPAEVEAWDHIALDYSLLLGSAKEREAAARSAAPLHIINVDNLVWLIDYWGDKWPYDTLVLDESSLFKSHQTRRFKKLKTRLARLNRVLLLTGTPAPNSLLDLWPQMYLLDQGKRLLRTFSAYRNHYFTSDYMGYNWTIRPGSHIEIHDKVADLCLRLDARDYLTLPERVDNRVHVELPVGKRANYQRLERDFLIRITEDDTITAANAGVLVGKLLQFANGAMYLENGDWAKIHDAKLDALAEIVETSAGHPILVAYNYRSDLARLKQRFKFATELDKDPRTIDRWNRGETRMLLAHPQSAGHGLNLQAGGSIIVWFGLTWSLEQYQQFNARLHRQGQTQTVVVHHIVARGTVDETVLEVLANKDAGQGGLLNALRRKAKQERAAA